MLAAIRAERARRAAEAERRTLAQDAERIRDRCRTLSGFVREAWHVLEPAAVYLHGWHIDAICAHLEAVTEGRLNRLLINVPPGTMKSLIVSVFWPAWEWGPRGLPGMRYLTTSYKEDFVKRDSRRMRDLVSSEWYRALWPEIVLSRAGEISFANTRTGNREGVAFSGLTAGRGDRVIIDDPHSTETAESPTEREKTTRIFRESVPTRLNDPVRSAIVVVMQRLHENDVSGQIATLGLGYEHLMLPMEFETSRRCRTGIGFEDPRLVEGELLFPERFPREVVERDKIPLGPYAVSGQFQQRPSPRKGGFFEGDWFRAVPSLPPRHSLRIYGASDYAVTSGGGDYTVHAVVGLDSDQRLYLLDLWRGQTDSAEWIEAFCDLVLLWKPLTWAEEGGQIRASLGPFLQKRMLERRAFCHRQQIPSRHDKAIRAQAIRARMAMTGLYVPADAPWRADLESEFLRFPTGAHDDQVDTLSLVGQLLDQMRGPAPPPPQPQAKASGYRSASPAAPSWRT